MRVVFHPGVRFDLDTILRWMLSERPTVIEPFEREIGEAIGRISVWPESAPIAGFDNFVRGVTLTRHPYRIFYRARSDAVQILHIRHSSRAPWEGGR